jgi:hypothetical protein
MATTRKIWLWLAVIPAAIACGETQSAPDIAQTPADANADADGDTGVDAAGDAAEEADLDSPSIPRPIPMPRTPRTTCKPTRRQQNA